MAVIKDTFNIMALPLAIERANPIPLDSTSIWYDRAEMEAYAATGATAYVGQILGLVDQDRGSATAFIIVNTDGALQEVGAATLGDNKSVVLGADGVLALKNFGKEYYRYVAEVGTEGEPGYVAAHYEKQIVDDTHPWKAGLQPLANADGTLGWYEPNPLTVDGINNQVAAVQNTVNTINNIIGAPADLADGTTIFGELDKKLDLTGGTMTGDLILKDGTKAASITDVNNAVASAGHLKREVVVDLPAPADANADTIYMVKDDSVLLGDAYKEYMLIEGELVQIGDTSVNLEPYVQKIVGGTVDNLVAVAADGLIADSGISKTAVSAHLNDTDIHITAQERANWDAEKGAMAAATANGQSITTLNGKVEALEDLVGVPADADAGVIATGLFDDIATLSGAIDALERANGQANVIEGIKIGENQLTPVDKIVTLPTFDGAAAGLVPVAGVDVIVAGTVPADYVLSAAGSWVLKADARIGDLTIGDHAYDTVEAYVGAAIEAAILVWEPI